VTPTIAADDISACSRFCSPVNYWLYNTKCRYGFEARASQSVIEESTVMNNNHVSVGLLNVLLIVACRNIGDKMKTKYNPETVDVAIKLMNSKKLTSKRKKTLLLHREVLEEICQGAVCHPIQTCNQACIGIL
jgi:hypothetical protein